MTNIVPGAIWQPIDVGNRSARHKGRGAVAHVAVSESPRLVPWGTPATRGADWHFYLPKEATPNGRFYQFIDLDLQCWSTYQANSTMPAWESQGGVTNADGEPWTENQVEAAAIIYAYLMETEGAPNQLMNNSLPSERGLGYHKLGIDPWRVSGGEIWSGARGKICPGQAKINGLPDILSRANELFHGSPSPAPKPPVHPVRPNPGRFAWNLPHGHYYGNINGPAQSHGGYYASERSYVKNIQEWLIYHGCAAGANPDWQKSTWDDGIWGDPTDQAMRVWHDRYYRGQPYPTQCWEDDYARLAVP